MNRRDFVISALIAAGGCVSRISAQTKVIEVDLSKLVDGKGLKVFNRNVSSFSDGPRRGLRLDAARGEGIAYLQGVEFANGSIELDIRGKEVREQSFVGVAFHGVDGTTYDAVYFRPFNFRAEDPVRRSHAVQYISSPIYKWQKLRTEHPGKYENAVILYRIRTSGFMHGSWSPAPKVSVFVEDAKEPSLVVGQLSDRGKGLTGLWVDNFGGDFANFKIVPA